VIVLEVVLEVVKIPVLEAVLLEIAGIVAVILVAIWLHKEYCQSKIY
jgi:hypothetical protein